MQKKVPTITDRTPTKTRISFISENKHEVIEIHFTKKAKNYQFW